MTGGKDFNFNDTHKHELAKSELPIVSPENKLKLLGVNENQAYFAGSNNDLWHFESSRRIWERLNSDHYYDVVAQIITGERQEKIDFNNIEDAVLYALKIHFHSQLEMYLREEKDETNSEKEYLGIGIDDIRWFVLQYNRLIALIGRIESESDQTKRLTLKKELADMLNEFDRERSEIYGSMP